MKKILCILGLLSLPLIAQEAPAQLWVGGNVEWLEIADQSSMNLGVRVGYQPVPVLSVGAWASTIASDVKHHQDNRKASVGYSSFGLMAEPCFFPKHKVHLLLPVSVGAASLRSVVEGDSTSRSNGWFSVFDAGLYVEMDLGQQLSLALGGGVRMSAGVDMFDLNNEDIKTIRLGTLVRWRSRD